MEFEVVETLAIDTDHAALADKGGWVYLIDDVENLTRLALLGQYEEHLDVMARVESLRIEHGDATVWFLVDAAGDFLIVARDDEELHGTAAGVHHLVEGCRKAESHVLRKCRGIC